MAKILIVDDSAVMRKALTEILTGLGHNVVGEADNGSAAFLEYLRLRPALVTMDLTMPGMSGLSATAKIVATFPEAKVVVISSMEGRSTIIEALEKGARHFIIKPITREKVATVVTSVLQQEASREKHQELVKRLKQLDADANMRPPTPPFQILSQNGLTVVEISDSLSVNSCQALCQEIAEHLTADTPRLLLDFGQTDSLDSQVLAAVDDFIGLIEKEAGQVRAVCRSQYFARAVCDAPAPAVVRLAAILRVLPAAGNPGLA